eukprot:CAMPEP_0117446474 /NCGR_PEP_ID=MMETSP0759-20121206/6359_1 /TAXON_ID=63605 /ORGANISM="Percolomonas cosmopolitus, Strain WS" /LENGTH=290 /DNA_ID=CAMNT_0005238741 /DNA_START=209 /DNA_END=1081 /DNA_ORIENTATION=+
MPEQKLPFVQIRKIKAGIEQSEGQGARVVRTIGSRAIEDVLDPFLLLDEFNVKLPSRFSDHPHRGFTTVTYMLEGTFTHRDNAGHSGTIPKGGVQWMNAGRGIIHSETPGPGPVNRGLQLWINLAAKDKMSKPDYQEYAADQLPKKKLDNGAHLTVVAGKSHGIESPIKLTTLVQYTHIEDLPKGEEYEEVIPEGYQGFIYVISGKGEILENEDDKSRAINTKAIMIFNETKEGSRLRIRSVGDKPLEFAIVAGTPLKEPVSRYGPMVMNTNEEIEQAFLDYHSGKFTST